MQIPSAAELLDVWEGALGLTSAHRALRLLAAAEPELSHDELALLPIGRRDARLLQLRESLFGSQLVLVVPCPQCKELIESQLCAADLGFAPDRPPQGTCTTTSHGYSVSFRLPGSADLIALAAEAEAGRARELLLTRCMLEARDPQSGAKRVADLPEAVLADLATHMEAADPGAVVELAFECPVCSHRWQEMFDIASFLWHEIHAWAQRTLRDVHALARAYGWREPDVLALSPTRRQIYLELCRQ